jgi:hypothetical protein
MQRLAGVLSMILGAKKKEAILNEAKTERQKPSIENIMAVFDKLKRTVFGNILVGSEEEQVVEFLKEKGLVAVEVEHYLDGNRGMMTRKYAKWIGGWSCGDCVHGSTCEKNIGKEIWYHDISFGRRCQRFMHKKLVEVMGDGC